MGGSQSSPQSMIRRGVYDSDYFSGAQVALYIGDVWVDEVTSLMFEMQEPRYPLYGYADTLFRDISRGQVLVRGAFSINFKEAGYLWLILNRYKIMIDRQKPPITQFTNAAGKDSEIAKVYNIEEQIVNDNIVDKLKAKQGDDFKALAEDYARAFRQRYLTGFASTMREAGGKEEMLGAESVFEAFENVLWGKTSGQSVGGYAASEDSGHRRVTHKDLNPFDIYITYGDYVGDDRLHHTIQKLSRVYLTGVTKQIVIDGQPIQEQYSFIARDLV